MHFASFRQLHEESGDVVFSGVIGGSGPPVLLLHGYPQTHLTWRRAAPVLAEEFTVIAPDLPGYGASRAVQDGVRWTKRRVADALATLMTRLGHERFAVVGHDRGARAGYRLALDRPQRVQGYASLTVVPTLDMWARTDKAFAIGAFHWFFLAQDFDLPERMLSADPDAFIDHALSKMAGGLDKFEPEVLDAYRSAFRDPAVRHAICEDYRAAAHEDAAHDAADRAAGRKLLCPVLVLWPASRGADAPTPLETWRRWADDVRGGPISGGHLQPEFSAPEVLAQLRPFLRQMTAVA
jgi:haloacetate dehalogenase